MTIVRTPGHDVPVWIDAAGRLTHAPLAGWKVKAGASIASAGEILRLAFVLFLAGRPPGW